MQKLSRFFVVFRSILGSNVAFCFIFIQVNEVELHFIPYFDMTRIFPVMQMSLKVLSFHFCYNKANC